METGRDTSWVDRRDAVPLYHQIFLTLCDEIASGKRPAGSAMPTEEELSALAGVSRITARRALHELAERGLVERRRRIGTHVTSRSILKPIEANVDQAVELLVEFGHNTKVRVMEIAKELATHTVAERLALSPGSPVVRAVRVRELSGKPLGRIVSHVPAALGAFVTRRRLTSTPILALFQGAGFEIGAAHQTISAIVADAGLADMLEIERRAPILQIERTVSDTAGRKLLLTSACYRADLYRINIDLHGQRALRLV